MMRLVVSEPAQKQPGEDDQAHGLPVGGGREAEQGREGHAPEPFDQQAEDQGEDAGQYQTADDPTDDSADLQTLTNARFAPLQQ